METTHRVVSKFIQQFMKLGGAHALGAPPGSYAYVQAVIWSRLRTYDSVIKVLFTSLTMDTMEKE